LTGSEMSKVSVERDGSVLTIIINRAEARNALDLEATGLLKDALAQFEGDDSVAAGVVWGADGSFCAGADLREMAEKGAVYEPWAGVDGPLARPCSKPLIAAVEGHAVAGGVGLALYCDMRVVAEDAVFGVFCRRFGVPMSDGTTVRLPRLIGLGGALDLLNTGRPVDAHEALRIGLADRVVPRGSAREAAEALARQMGEFPQVALRADRWSAINQAGKSLDEALRLEAEGAEEAKRLEAQGGARRFAEGEGRGVSLP
jgi:enoyl-CoA hydratase